MARGRKPKPARQKKLEGNRGKRKPEKVTPLPGEMEFAKQQVRFWTEQLLAAEKLFKDRPATTTVKVCRECAVELRAWQDALRRLEPAAGEDDFDSFLREQREQRP